MGLLSRMGRAATALSKYYYPFTWRNKPSIESPINEVHLNHIEDGINEMDNRILILAQDKADASDMANVFIDFDIDDTTGTMTFTRFDGTKKSRDTPMEKIILNCYLEDDNFVLVLADGTKQKVSLAKFIDTYTFTSSDTIRFSVNGKNISADIPDGKITLAKLEPTIMSTIRQYTMDAQTAKGVAEQAAGTAQGWAIGGTGFEDNNAKHYASRSQRYAVGGVEEGDTEDNAKSYCQKAQAAAEQAKEVAGFDGTASTVSAIDTQGVAVRKASGTGHVTITDAAEHPLLNLNLAGKSEQVSTTGAQLLVYPYYNTTKTQNGITFTALDDGRVSIKGTVTGNNATYILQQNLILPPGTYTKNNPGTIKYMISRYLNGAFDRVEVSQNDGTFDTDGWDYDVYEYKPLLQTVTVGDTFDNLIVSPMLNAGATAKPWEPYTGGKPSPSPDYPQPIISTGTMSTGAQLLDISKIPGKTGGGATVINNGDNCIINGSGTMTAVLDTRYTLSHEETMKLIGDERTFTVSANVSTFPYFIFNFYDNSGAVATLQLKNVTSVTNTIPDSADINSLYIQFGYYGSKDVAIISGSQKVMVNAGATAKPWEPYTGGKPSPSPDYPQPMDVTVTGAQLLDLGVVADISAGGTTVITVDGDYTISGTGALTASVEKRYRTNIKKLLKPGNLILKSEITIPRLYVSIRNTRKSTELLSLYGNMTKQITQEMLDDENIYVEVMFFGSKGTVITPGTYYPMLYQDGDGTWEPYQSGTATITLTEPLRGIGDTQDRVMCRDGVWGIERYISHYKLTSDIVSASSGGVTTTNNIIDNRYTVITCEAWKNIIKKELYENGKKTIGFCTIAPPGMINDWNTSKNGKENVYTINAAGAMYISIPISSLGITADATRAEVTAAVKQYVADNDVYVMFILDSPTWEPLPSATQSALNALTTYTGTTHVTITAGGAEPDVGLEYFGQPGDKVTVQDMCDSFAAPGFDDSGVVQGISGFGDFLNRMTSGMRLPSFFRDLKAGLKFVLHTGQLVNNGLCNEPGKYPLDAAYGRTLLEMIGNTANLPGGAADIVSAIVTQNRNLSDKTNTSDFNNLKNSIVMVNVTGFAIGIDGNNVIIQWLTGENREFGYALNIGITDGTMQFFYRENGTWKPSWNK